MTQNKKIKLVPPDIFSRVVENQFNVKVVREFMFHPTRKWRIDYAIPEHKLAIENEGGVFSNGRHTRGSGFLADCDKYNQMTVLGWRLIRVTPQTLISKSTLDLIGSVLAQK